MTARDLLSRDPHMDAMERILQPIDYHCVDEGRVPHPRHRSKSSQNVGSKRHAVLPTGNDDIRIAAADGLRRQINRSLSGAADLIDGHGRDCVWQSSLDRCLTGRIWPQPP